MLNNVKKSSLRDLTKDDLPLILSWRNTERIRKNMRKDHLISIEEHRAWFKNLQQTNETFCKIFVYDDEPAGIVNYTNIAYDVEACSWGFYLGLDNLPAGTGYQMGKLGLQFAFEELNLQHVLGEVFDFNARSIRFHLKMGFQEDRSLQEEVMKEDKSIILRKFIITREQYRERSRRDE